MSTDREDTEMNKAELLLKAGAVLPPGTTGAGPDAVDLTARSYRHPGLGDDRVVVRLAPPNWAPPRTSPPDSWDSYGTRASRPSSA